MQTEQDAIIEEAQAAADEAQDSRALYEAKMKFLGRTGKVTALLKGMRDIAAELRPAFGKRVNELREKLEAMFAAREERMKQRELAAKLAHVKR